MPAWLAWTFWPIALTASIFYGWKACDIFAVSSSDKPLAWKIHQFWLNFVGSMAGWYACWALLPEAAASFSPNATPAVSLSSAILAAVGFVGITGYLPFAVVGLLQGIKEIALKATGLSKVGGKGGGGDD